MPGQGPPSAIAGPGVAPAPSATSGVLVVVPTESTFVDLRGTDTKVVQLVETDMTWWLRFSVQGRTESLPDWLSSLPSIAVLVSVHDVQRAPYVLRASLYDGTRPWERGSVLQRHHQATVPSL